jgi:hydroxymethylglutaryl-CoA synthase
MVGIAGYGGYVPRYRIATKEIAAVWNEDGDRVAGSLLIDEKAVAGLDEDTVTISVEAAKNALRVANIKPGEIGALFVGSESHPYAVKSSAAIVAEAIGSTPYVMAASLEFACKAGTAGMQMCMGLVGSGMIEYGMAIGADTAQGRPNDALEYSAASGGAAFIIGKKKNIAEINDTVTYTTDTPDFWRRSGMEFPSHAGRFTGDPAYFRHTSNAAMRLMEKTGSTPEDYDYLVPHQPNGKFPMKLAEMLGFKKETLMPGMLVGKIGNTYSGSSPLGLANVLDSAKPGDRILMVSYGSGSGADAFDITVMEGIEKARARGIKIMDYVNNKEYVSYGVYSKYRKKLKGI